MLDIKPIVEAPGAEDYLCLFVGSEVVVSLRRSPEDIWMRHEAESIFGTQAVGEPMGYWCGRPCYALEVDQQQINAMEHTKGHLLTLFGRVSDAAFATYGRALQMLSWRRDHQFCGRCGSATEAADAGKALACGACGLTAYPRLHPCVIVAVGRGDELLLAEAAGGRTGFHSTLAGFIEPGETAEEAVIREVREEVGLTVSNVRYFQSQPWPFPSQLMLGFFADYVAGEITVEPSEIARAGWYRRGHEPRVPPPASIAGQLINHFYASH